MVVVSTVRIQISVRIRVNVWVSVSVGLKLGWRTENSACHVYLSVPDRK